MRGRRGSNKPGKAKFRDSVDSLRIEPIASGRALALLALQQHDVTGRFIADLMTQLDSRHQLSRQERGLAIDVAAGTIRRRRTIDILLQSQVQRPRAEVEPDLWRILQIGTQQLCFGRSPDHAAVDSTVELTRSLGRSRWCGFVNGVLRNIVRLLCDETSAEPGRRAMPLADGSYRLLNSDVFACPLTAPADYFGEAFSLPRVIARRWHKNLTHNDLLTAGFHSLRTPTIGLRVNTLKATVSQVAELLSSAGIAVTPGRFDESLRLESAGRIESLPGYDDGLWSVQDESAMAASRLLDPKSGEWILDLCAAPGGKSTHLAELSRNEATIVACDVTDGRVERIAENAWRLQLKSIQPTLVDCHGGDIPDGPFDAALVDVPCSNTGVLARRPEARWRFAESDLEELVQLQTRLLMTAYDRLKPGGRLVYSTCSIEPEETTRLVRNVVAAVPKLTLVSEQLLLPGQDSDGAFVALLQRQSDAESAS